MLLRSIAARRARVTLALLAIGVGSGVAIALGSLALQVGDDVARQLRSAGPNFLVQPRAALWAPDLGGAETAAGRAGATLPESSLTTLKHSFWRHNLLDAAPELDARARSGGASFRLVGSWFRHELPTEDGAWSIGLAGLHPAWKVAGRWPEETKREIALGRDLAGRLHARPGSSLALVAGDRRLSVTVSGVVTAGGAEDGIAWAPLALVQEITGRGASVDRIRLSALLVPKDPRPAPDPARDPKGYERFMCTAYPHVVAAALERALPGAEVIPATEQITGEGRIVTRLTLLMVLLALAAVAASTLGLLSTMTAAVVERATELALLRAIGASPRQLAVLLLGETLLVSALGGTLGWLIGSAGAAAIRGASFAGAAAYRPLLLPVALAVALAVGLLGTLGPLRLALRLDPARVLRG